VAERVGTLRRLAADLDLYRRLAGAYVRSEMQYKVSFFCRFWAAFLGNIIDFAALAVILSRIERLAGWSLGEVALLYGLSAVCFSVAEMLAGALDDFDQLVQGGGFDRLLIRPLGTLFQAMTEGFSLRRLGRMSQGPLVLFIAQRELAIHWTPDKALVLLVALASGVTIFFSIFVLGAVFCFWIVQAKEATHVFTYGGDFLASYPLDVYRGWLRHFVTFVVPLAFVNYYPALYLLERPDPLGLPPWTRLLSPVVAALMALLAWRAWSAGVRHYQSTGT
jgi:ABC-2 type transport system permease protein